MPSLRSMLDATNTTTSYQNDIREQDATVFRNYQATIAKKRTNQQLKLVNNTTTIQSAFRQNKTEKNYKQQLKSITTIQSAFRRHKTKKTTKND